MTTDLVITREMLADRYDGLLGTCAGNYDKGTALKQMDHFRKLVERIGRSGQDDETIDARSEIVDELAFDDSSFGEVNRRWLTLSEVINELVDVTAREQGIDDSSVIFGRCLASIREHVITGILEADR